MTGVDVVGEEVPVHPDRDEGGALRENAQMQGHEESRINLPEPFEVIPGLSPIDGLVAVNAVMSYDEHRRYQVVVGTPQGPVTSRVYTRYAQTQHVVEEIVRPFPEVGPEIRVQVDITAPEPSWLSVGQPVLVRADSTQPGREAAPGWIGAFLEGGVWVMGVGGREDALFGADELGDEAELTSGQRAQINAAVQRAQDTFTVEVRHTFDADRRYRLSLDTPDGPVTSEPLARTRESGPTAARMVAAAYGDAPAVPCISSQRPPWLSHGQPVIIRGQVATGIGETTSEAGDESFGWIGGFVQGGVYVNDLGNEDGWGIYPPEDLDDSRKLTPEQLAQVEESKRLHAARPSRQQQ
ncbi:hypothetical protein LWF15_13110 [Kineosporia rhizophila]|uniref:hypothetical protein n=1 Tax=Kineosporia TaxID=49184 RepID=UPI001E557BDA|nr:MULTISPECIES: hypothetical protein [Kineosporia]MCE0536451.1 hypothetical protein [Kineosporia rhizophila]GLY15455.1 hypothetical protein Kisp01_24700 [Kineosporia sp. NBRC 101677]